MVFDYTWNGIVFELEYVHQEDASNTHWTDVYFVDYSAYGAVVVDSKVVGEVDIEYFTADAQVQIRKEAYEYFLTLDHLVPDDEDRADFEYHAQKEDW